MLKATSFEFIVRILPEAFIFIFAAYAFSRSKVKVNKYIIASILLGISVFCIRMLPINYGVHTILNIIMQTVIVTYICNINMIEAIKCAIITAVTLFIFEGINMLALNLIFGENVVGIFADVKSKTIAGLPSLGLFGIIVIGYYIYLCKRKKFVYV